MGSMGASNHPSHLPHTILERHQKEEGRRQDQQGSIVQMSQARKQKLQYRSSPTKTIRYNQKIKTAAHKYKHIKSKVTEETHG